MEDYTVLFLAKKTWYVIEEGIECDFLEHFTLYIYLSNERRVA